MTNPTYLGDPKDLGLPPYRCDEAYRLRERFADPSQVYWDKGALHWVSNDAPVPMSCFDDAMVKPPANQESVCREATDRFMAEYRANRRSRTPSDEQLFEMRAAFGPDIGVVDIVTGQKFRI